MASRPAQDPGPPLTLLHVLASVTLIGLVLLDLFALLPAALVAFAGAYVVFWLGRRMPRP